MLSDRTIYPRTGFGDLKFFMNPQDVHDLLGPPEGIDKDENDNVYLFYLSLGLVMSFDKEKDYTLSWISLEPPSEASFLFTPLFSHTPDTLIKLIQSVHHVVLPDPPTKKFPHVLNAISLGMMFYFDHNKQLQEFDFHAPDEAPIQKAPAPISVIS